MLDVNCCITHRGCSLVCPHQGEGDARQSGDAHADLCGFGEFLGLVNEGTQKAGTHDATHDEESATYARKVLQACYSFIHCLCQHFQDV